MEDIPFLVKCHYEPRGDNGLEGFLLGKVYKAIPWKKGFKLYSTTASIVSEPGSYLGYSKGKNILRRYFEYLPSHNQI